MSSGYYSYLGGSIFERLNETTAVLRGLYEPYATQLLSLQSEFSKLVRPYALAAVEAEVSERMTDILSKYSSALSVLESSKSIPRVEDPHSSQQSDVVPVSMDATDTSSINQVNKAYLERLKQRSSSFVKSLVRTDFEDGMDNDLTEEVLNYVRGNQMATYLWLNTIYSSNQHNDVVLSGLLRIIANVVDVEDSDLLLPMVKAALSDRSSNAQEAAIMVIEKWRTKNCLDALETANIQSSWVRSYAESVKKELISELKNVN